jgi:phage-related tail fiber protein
VFRDPDDAPGIYTAELAVPATVGGWVMREVGVFDDTGSLYLYGNLPDSYKPLEVDGAYSDGFVRVKFALANASIVTLQINPNVAVASQAWVLNTITMAALLPGGTTGQMATKASNADGDIWADPNLVGVNITVDIIEEVQTLAAGQTAVTLTTCTTSGLSLYIGQAVGASACDPTSGRLTAPTTPSSHWPPATRLAPSCTPCRTTRRATSRRPCCSSRTWPTWPTRPPPAPTWACTARARST